MFLYVGIYLLLVITGQTSSKRPSRLLLILWTLFFVVFAGTREETGCDFLGYLNRFLDYAYVNVPDVITKPEPLFSLLNILIIRLGLDFMWVNLAASVIIFSGFAAFAGRCERPVHFLALAFPILIVQLAMSGIRQAMALGLLLLALNAFRDGQRLRMIVWILLASQFHTSAIVFLPLALMIGRDPTIWWLIAVTILAAPVAIYFTGDRLDTYQSRYGEGEVESFGAIFRVLLIAIGAIFFVIYRNRYRQLYRGDFALMQVFAIMSFALIAVFTFSTIAAHRLGYYIMPVHILMLLRLPNIMRPGRPEPIVAMMPFLAYGAYITVWFSTSRHAKLCYIPYDSYLF